VPTVSVDVHSKPARCSFQSPVRLAMISSCHATAALNDLVALDFATSPVMSHIIRQHCSPHSPLPAHNIHSKKVLKIRARCECTGRKTRLRQVRLVYKKPNGLFAHTRWYCLSSWIHTLLSALLFINNPIVLEDAETNRRTMRQLLSSMKLVVKLCDLFRYKLLCRLF